MAVYFRYPKCTQYREFFNVNYKPSNPTTT